MFIGRPDDDEHDALHRARRPCRRPSLSAVERSARVAVADVADAFRVRRLADDDDADVRAGRRRGGVGGEREVRVRRVGLHALEDRRADVVLLPDAPCHVDGPAAGLVAEVVGVAAGDVDVRGRARAAGRRRSSAAPATRPRPGGRPRGGRRLPIVEALRAVGVRVLEQAELELLREDPPHRVVDPRPGVTPPLRDEVGQVVLEVHVLVAAPSPCRCRR